MHTVQMITLLILDGILCKSYFLLLYFPLFFPPFLLLSSSSLLVSNLCGEQGRIAGGISRYRTRFFTPFYSFHWILSFTLESEDLNGALRVFPVQGLIFFYKVTVSSLIMVMGAYKQWSDVLINRFQNC